MKRLFMFIFLFTSLFTSIQVSAQLRKIPAEVTDAFKDKFPDAANVEWKDKLTGFEANFKIADGSYEARFNNKGEWQETEKIMEPASIPAAVKDGYDKSKYTAWELKELSYLEKKDTTYYRVLVRKNEFEKKYLFFDDKGKLLKEQITL
jgi:hypothetical protein